jgi:hypothetical protein
MAYPLDANVFIAAKNLHYGLDFCPAFWEWLAREHAADRVFSIEKVVDELRAGGDELAEWVARLPDAFSLKPDAFTASSLARVAQWVNAQTQYSPAAKSTFLQIADYYLVAQALAGGHIVVTHEVPQNSVHRVKIPNVCLGLNVPYLTPFEMLRRERARFVLERRP